MNSVSGQVAHDGVGHVRRRVVIVGGGLAGLSAAEMLVNHFGPMVEVTVVEARRFVGGRVGSFHDRQMDATIDYCQHVTMGCCVNFLDFLRRCDLEKDWAVTSTLVFADLSAGLHEIKPWKWLPAPFHQLPLMWRLPFLASSKRREVQLAMLRLVRTKTNNTFSTITAGAWLRQHGQSEESLNKFWNVFCLSALGDEAENVSFEALRKLFVDGFAMNRESSDLWVPTEPLSYLFGEKLVRHLMQKGVRFRTGFSVTKINQTKIGFNLLSKDGRDCAGDHVVMAVPWHQIGKLVCDFEPLDYLQEAGKIPASSITGIHLWFDRDLGDFAQVVATGTTAQWIFRPSWIQPNSVQSVEVKDSSAHYYQVVISGSQKWSFLSHEELISRVSREIRQLIPAAKDAKLIQGKVVTDHRAVMVCHPEFELRRPKASTPLPHLHLAGDWTDTQWPSTMEGAVISGRQAVASVAETEGWTIPSVNRSAPKGLLARLLLG